MKVLANEFMALALDFAHDEIFSWSKYESKLLQDLVHLKLLQTTVYSSSSSATASSVTFATVRDVLDDGCGHSWAS